MSSPYSRLCRASGIALVGACATASSESKPIQPAETAFLEAAPQDASAFFRTGGKLGDLQRYHLGGLAAPTHLWHWRDGLAWQTEAADQLYLLRPDGLCRLTLPVPCRDFARNGADLWAASSDGRLLVRVALPDPCPQEGVQDLRTNLWTLDAGPGASVPARGLVLAKGRLWRLVNLGAPKGHVRLEGWDLPGWRKPGRMAMPARVHELQLDFGGRVATRLTLGGLGEFALWDSKGITQVAFAPRKGFSRALRQAWSLDAGCRLRARLGLVEAETATGRVRVTTPHADLSMRLGWPVKALVEGPGGLWGVDTQGERLVVFNPWGFEGAAPDDDTRWTPAMADNGLEQPGVGPNHKVYLLARTAHQLVAVDPGDLRAALTSPVGLEAGGQRWKDEAARTAKARAQAQAAARKRDKARTKAHAQAQARIRAEQEARHQAAPSLPPPEPTPTPEPAPHLDPDLPRQLLVRHGPGTETLAAFRRGLDAATLETWIRTVLEDPAGDRVQDAEGCWWVTRTFPHLVGWLEADPEPVELHRLTVQVDEDRRQVLDASPVR